MKEKKRRRRRLSCLVFIPKYHGHLSTKRNLLDSWESECECPLIARSRQITLSHPTQRRRSGSSDRFSPVGQQHNTCAVSMVGSLFFSSSSSLSSRAHTHTHLVLLWKGWFLCQCTSAHVCESVSRMTRTVLSVLVCSETSLRSDSALGACQRQCDGLRKTQPKTD